MRVLANDFTRQWAEIESDALAALQRVGRSGWYILGAEVEAFEKALAAAWPVPHAVGVASGLDALEIALRCVGVRPGDRVVTTPLSAFATTLAVMRVGATPVFVDTDDQGLIDLEACARHLAGDPAVRCLLPVHLYGMPADLDALESLRSRFGIAVVEDCAQSILATWKGRPGGSASDIFATSFYPTKNLGAMGDGGAVLTGNADHAARARCLRNYGQSAQYVHAEPGLNSRLDELHAAMLREAMLPRLAAWTARRREIAARMMGQIRNKAIRLPAVPAAADPCWHLFPVFVAPASRASLQAHLRQNGVLTGVHYPELIPLQPALKIYGRAEVIGDLPRAQAIVRSEVSLPVHPFLTPAEVDHVIAVCNSWKEP